MHFFKEGYGSLRRLSCHQRLAYGQNGYNTFTKPQRRLSVGRFCHHPVGLHQPTGRYLHFPKSRIGLLDAVRHSLHYKSMSSFMSYTQVRHTSNLTDKHEGESSVVHRDDDETSNRPNTPTGPDTFYESYNTTAKENASRNNLNEDEDFYGINLTEDLSKTDLKKTSKVSDLNIREKFPFLKKSTKNLEKVIEFPFGTVRFDDARRRNSMKINKSNNQQKEEILSTSNILNDDDKYGPKFKQRSVISELTETLKNKEIFESKNKHVANIGNLQSLDQSTTIALQSKNDKLSNDTKVTENVKQIVDNSEEHLNNNLLKTERKKELCQNINERESIASINRPSRRNENKSGSNYFDEMYFDASHSAKINSSEQEVCIDVEPGDTLLADNVRSRTQTDIDQDKKSNDTDRKESDYNYFDEKYFNINSQDFDKLQMNEKVSANFNISPPNAKDEERQNITNNVERMQDRSKVHKYKEDNFDAKDVDVKSSESQHQNETKNKKRQQTHNLFDEEYFGSYSKENKNEMLSKNMNSSSFPFSSAISKSTLKETETQYVDTMTRHEEKRKNRPVPNLEQPETAFDAAMKIRLEKKSKTNVGSEGKRILPDVTPKNQKWSGKKDSKGFRILTEQVLHLDQLPQEVMVKILKDSILYEDEKIVAIYKPYGLPSHGGPDVHYSVGTLLGPLAKMIDKKGDLEMLHVVHRLDKETTGVMLLAKSEEVAATLHNKFIKREVIKKYWVITKGVPNPPEGIIDIPIAEGQVAGKYRMALRPVYGPEVKEMMRVTNKGPRSDAVTQYKVLSSHGSAALVECLPETGVKHQIRCHMAFALNTPILGDHKYSHFSKMAPQKLPPDMLQRLGIRQSKVRHTPMHLHAHALILPQFNDGRNLFIRARLPSHFVQNMKWLKLTPP